MVSLLTFVWWIVCLYIIIIIIDVLYNDRTLETQLSYVVHTWTLTVSDGTPSRTNSNSLLYQHPYITYTEFLNLSAFHISPLYKINILQYMGETFDAEFQRYFTIIQNSCLSIYGWDILCGISKGTFEIPHKISHPYIERYVIYSNLRALRFKSSEAFLKRSPGQQ